MTFKDEPRATVSAGNNSLQTVITGPRHIGPGALSFPRVPRLIGKQLPSIRTFKIFLAVVKYGTFAAAGDEVGLTAAAVGSNIRGMEEEMKVRFFERSGRAVTLNAAGRRAVPQIEELVLRYEGLLGSSGTGPTAGQLVMGAMVSSLFGTFADALWALRMNSPMLDVHLIAGQSSSFTRRIEEGSLDGAIMCRAPGALEPHMSWWPLYLEKMIFIVPRNSLFELACDPLDQLRTAPFIQFDRQIWTGALVQQVLNQCDVRPRRHLELNSSEAIIELVRQGFGVAIVPMLAKVNWADDQYMKILPLPGGGVQRQVGLLERTHHHRKRLTEALRSYFEGLRPSP